VTDVLLPESALAEIRTQGEAAYPEECCGFLIGVSEGDNVRRVTRVRPAINRVEKERERRFVIPAEELLRAEAELGPGETSVVGFYHSHPDHPPRPSEFDREHAWPWYSYLVLAVQRGLAGAMGAFELDPESRTFQPVGLTTAPRSEADPPPRLNRVAP
jgi:proteasome lid subunit RPN8/RPN11